MKGGEGVRESKSKDDHQNFFPAHDTRISQSWSEILV